MSGVSTPPSGEKPTGGVPEHLEHIATHDRVPGHENYYEKDGLRTYGDGEDHDHEPPMSFRRLMSLVAMAFIWTGSQIPVYIFGGIPPYIYADLGGVDRCVYPSRPQRNCTDSFADGFGSCLQTYSPWLEFVHSLARSQIFWVVDMWHYSVLS